MSERLTWNYGPEANTRRRGCVKFAVAGAHRWEIRRAAERSLISGRILTTYQLYLDGVVSGPPLTSMFEVIRKADAQWATLIAGRPS